MYRIRYGSILLHDPRDEDCVLSDAECEIAVNDAGTLKFTMPRHHPMHGLLKPMDKDQEVVLENDGYEMFRGRVLSIEEGFYGGGLVTCEGELAYLNDVLLRPYSTTEPGVPSSVDGYFAWLVSEYNKQTDERFRFVVGINQGYELDPNNYILRENRNYPTIGQEMKDKLVGKLGGYIRIRHEGGLRYIDYIASGDNASSQRIEFGENLIDFTHERDWSEYRTVVVPVGKAPEGSDRKLDVSGEPNAPLAGGLSKIGDRIVDDAAVREFGYIEQVVEFDDVTIASNLVQSGARWLRNVRIGDTLTMTAIDLSDIDPNLKPIFIGDFVRATSRPHGFDEYFVCSKLTIKVSNPDGNTFVLGNEYGYMTGKQAEKIAELNASINKVYSETVAISGEAKQTAQQAKDAADKAVLAVVDEYAISSSTSEPPQVEWDQSTPAWEPGKFIWRRVKSTYGDGTTSVGEPALMSGSSGHDGEDATVLRIDSSRGTVFKNNAVSTVLKATVYRGSSIVSDVASLKAAFGAGAYLEWSWQKIGEDAFGVISSADPMIGNGGFTLTVTPNEVDTKVVFQCKLTIS